ncbi:2-oxoglutarate dehydrogenase complex dihydrolipoyllysine-residue succinyltransferase [Calycomorphotria hydatis]|uniref:Dihydrolipoyllysine-residue succinyltransferase component of 2-oxoglutarate dehydrogenase complex n=1 Tax=Calycomorphotria hydatis TaxID=2528027 RepID=A0A517T5Z7_9PLAN|nr:2-oxoglutarate dehydrogenase complex dihydrolipoyllysine-residue succinyltransferase [Calycomorphotria hydatis]QDT63805.1 Dihydrolipoyllysine-residue succinyltransferase component of 2-oxoglutarate dehydrogenase complex [Calycomorphotria hydatis]
MPVEVKVPQVGESITEVQIAAWHLAEGDYVEMDDDVCELETDKATVEVPAPISGIISKINVQAGQNAAVGDVIAVMEEAEAPAESAAPKQDAPSSAPAPQSASPPSNGPTSSPAPAATAGSSDRVMPAAERALAEHGLKAEQVPATGPGGRLLKEDVSRYVESKPSAPAAPAPSTPSTLPATAMSGERSERTQAMSPIRKRIAQRLVDAQHNAALLTTFNEIDMSAIMAFRKQYQDYFVKKYEVKLGFMSFFVKAVVEGIKEIPQVGAQIEGDQLIYQNYCDIGIAVGGGKGLVVPILRNAERMSFAEIELKIADFGRRARDNKIDLEELQGGTFTITNGGIYGSLLSTPIVNPPQSGVLGMHNIVERPMVVNGQIVARPMMYVALTYDHRVIDGREAVTFLRRIKETLEEPARMLIEV